MNPASDFRLVQRSVVTPVSNCLALAGGWGWGVGGGAGWLSSAGRNLMFSCSIVSGNRTRQCNAGVRAYANKQDGHPHLQITSPNPQPGGAADSVYIRHIISALLFCYKHTNSIIPCNICRCKESGQLAEHTRETSRPNQDGGLRYEGIWYSVFSAQEPCCTR